MKRTALFLVVSTLLACATRQSPPPSAPDLVVAAGAVPVEVLEEGAWRVVSYFDGQRAMASPLLDAAISASFGHDGRITGNAGCNQYSAAYRLDEAALSVGPVAATRRFCAEPPGVMEQEARYFEALQSAVTLRRVGEMLQLRTEQDSLAIYLKRKSDVPPEP